MSTIQPDLIPILLCLAAAGVMAVAWMGRGSSARDMDAGQLARLAVDIHEINNLMSLHAWYHAALMHDVEIDEIWSARDDIVLWFEASGRFEGPGAIRGGYGREVSRKATRGIFTWHTITTPVVEVAADGETAKGIWYTPGIAGFFKEDRGNFNWMFEKYAVDFVREDGVWKIWHMHVYSDIGWSLGGAIDADGSMGGVPEVLRTLGSLGGPPPGKAPDAPGTPYKTLGPDTEIELRPRPPVPYRTWSETWSYTDPGE